MQAKYCSKSAVQSFKPGHMKPGRCNIIWHFFSKKSWQARSVTVSSLCPGLGTGLDTGLGNGLFPSKSLSLVQISVYARCHHSCFGSFWDRYEDDLKICVFKKYL